MNTNEQHIENGGDQCPHCNSKEIQGGCIYFDTGSAWQEVTCNDCGKEWQDLYTLTGYATTNK